MSEEEVRIPDFYCGRSILITGGTGFLGKVLVEKLLRSCPGVERIYLLVRPKKGQDPNSRLHKLLSLPIFGLLREHHPDRLGKVEVINGDLTHGDLGLTEDIRQQLQNEVSIVFHSAATVRFDDSLKKSVGININGTLSVIRLSQNMPKLEALVQVSTAYSNCYMPEIHEEIYPPPADPDRIMQCVECLDEDILESVTDQITRDHPNTYTFTKALAENILLKQSGHLPIAIIRPSIVTAAWRDPMPGWVDNLNGPTGVIIGAGKGVLRTLLCHRDKVADLIPVDVVINLTIAVAWHVATSKTKKLEVYNCTSGTTNPITWGYVEDCAKQNFKKYPFNDVMWYPGGSFKSNRFHNTVCRVVFHLIPACLLDTIAIISRQKPVMLEIHKRIYTAVTALEFFTTHEWKFTNTNVARLQSRLQPADSLLFNFDISKLDWKQYMKYYVLGTRQFLLKEDPKTLDSARQKLRR